MLLFFVCIAFAMTEAELETKLLLWMNEIWQRHPTIHAQQKRIQEYTLQQDAIETWKDPTLQLSVAPLGAGYAISIRQPYLYPKEHQLKKEHASIQLKKAQRNLDLSKESLQKSFLIHLVDWMYAKRKLELSQQHQSLILAHKKSVQGRVEVGAVPEAVLAQLESELADLELLQIGYQNDIVIHRLQLEELLGHTWKEDISLQIPPTLPSKNKPPAALTLPKLNQKEAQIMEERMKKAEQEY